ncbi:SDR family NAD(P)-dependent oxidoreductase [Bosea psychrotolerans]|uniref:3-oxoacyl-[acyl-carrier protein] reductase n=1 Tax=Bosea psychrotolerans TaxID=1871628 RepID=A0A2S4LW04_9HYPH|nr:SDR family oxidoreductase [Bosea psychrotolerans]POR46617.1 3-oxoacyl-[acyl-carrier protein] reductase [Bosea psychrotolerans]
MIIVTGGTHGIGRACVERLSPQGVVFTGRDREAGEALAAAHPGAHFVAGDVASEADCRHVVEAALALGEGRLSGLVNNAGLGRRMEFATATAEDWDVVMGVNARSAFLFTRNALAGLRAGRGSVVNVASVAGRAGEEGLAVYCASKAAVIAMTQSLALEFGDEVRFNAICPGQIATRMMAGIMADEMRLRQLELRIPAGRLGEPGEVADVIEWLLSDKASYVNGAVLTVDGGETAGLRTPRMP